MHPVAKQTALGTGIQDSCLVRLSTHSYTRYIDICDKKEVIFAELSS